MTDFILQYLKQSRMVDLVEDFLKALPLIKVDESDPEKHVRSCFPSGQRISTGWGSRDAVALVVPWGLKDTPEEAEQKVHSATSFFSPNRGMCVFADLKLTVPGPSLTRVRSFSFVNALETPLHPHKDS